MVMHNATAMVLLVWTLRRGQVATATLPTCQRKKKKAWRRRDTEKETFRSCHETCSWVCESSSVMETVLGLWNIELASPPTTGILTFSLKGHQSFHVFTSAFNVNRKVSERMKGRGASEKKRERQDLDTGRGEAGLWEIQDQKEKKTKAISSQT